MSSESSLHDNKRLYCETIDPDNENQAQDCIDYDPYPVGSGGNGGGVDENNSPQVIKEESKTPLNETTEHNVTSFGGKSHTQHKNFSPSKAQNFTDDSTLSFQKTFIQSVTAATQKTTIENENQKSMKRLKLGATEPPVSAAVVQLPAQSDLNSPTATIAANTTTDSTTSEQWHTVGFFSSLNTKVTDYIPYSAWSASKVTDSITSDAIPNLENVQRVKLEPGTAYRFRLRAINGFGMGEPGEAASFKTCLPGFPGAPSSIKISKSADGAHLVWQPPPVTAAMAGTNEKLEFTVYLAIKSPQRGDNETIAPGQLAFVRVYSGFNSQCLVSNQTLATAHVDYSAKPAIIFRIAAKNNKGYGPATQVRWLQDSSIAALSASSDSNSTMKSMATTTTTTTKGVKRK